MKPSPGVTQRSETTKRNFKDEADRRNIESVILVDLDTPSSKGRHTTWKKRVFERNRLVTFYRRMDSSVSGKGIAPGAVKERTQISKNKRGDLKGTMIREYFSGAGADASGVRMIIRFEPQLLLKTYRAKVYLRSREAGWRAVASGAGASLAQAMERAKDSLGASEGHADPLAELIVNLWTGSLASAAPFDLTHLLTPLVTPGGDAFMKEADMALLIGKTLSALPASGGQRAYWMDLSPRLEQAQSLLARLSRPGGSAHGPLDEQAQLYAQSLAPLLAKPEGPMPSQLEWMQEMTRWIFETNASLAELPPGTGTHDEFMASLPSALARHRDRHAEELYSHALHVLHIAEAIRSIDSACESLDKAGGPENAVTILRKTQADLAKSSSRWKSILARHPAPSMGGGTLWALLLPILLPETSAWAEGETAGDFFDIFYSFPQDPMSLTPDFSLPMVIPSLDEIPELPSQVFNANFIEAAFQPVAGIRSIGNAAPASRTLEAASRSFNSVPRGDPDPTPPPPRPPIIRPPIRGGINIERRLRP